MRDAFTQAQMATMYNRFDRKDVAEAPEAVQAAHAMATAPKKDHVGDKRQLPPTVAKLQSMTVAVCGFNWQEFVAKYTESFTQERTAKNEEKEYYEKEIIKEIGRKQFQESLGTSIIKTTNKHGETVYVRSRGTKTREAKHTQKLDVQKTADIDEGDLGNAIMGIRDKFKAAVEHTQGKRKIDDDAGGQGPQKKKPAAAKKPVAKKPAAAVADDFFESDASIDEDEDEDGDEGEESEEENKKTPYDELHTACRKVVAAAGKKDTDAVIMKAKVAKDKGAKSAVEALNEALGAMHAEIKVDNLWHARSEKSALFHFMFHFYFPFDNLSCSVCYFSFSGFRLKPQNIYIVRVLFVMFLFQVLN